MLTIEELKKDRYWLTGYTETELECGACRYLLAKDLPMSRQKNISGDMENERR